MSDWDEEYREPTEDERSARRILALAIALINARRPLTTTEIRRDLYPNMGDEAFRKAFRRDRQRLVVAGLVMRRARSMDDEASWEMDDEVSFARENALEAQDALVLDLLLLPIASDPSFPYARDLRHALAKIDRSFDGTSMASLPPQARVRNNNLTRLEDCMTAGHAARISYTRADGTQLERTVAPYGLFSLRGETYLVAAPAGPDATDRDDAHTYNLARVHSVRPLPRMAFSRPEDFDVRDFIRLPFQMGEVLYVASFTDPSTQDTLTEEVADEGLAAAWAIGKGLVPTAPQSLVDEWQLRLERACGGEGA